jgi:hypothetical protein
MQASLQTGDAIMLDRHGRLAPIHWDLMNEWIKQALSTDAGEDTEDAVSAVQLAHDTRENEDARGEHAMHIDRGADLVAPTAAIQQPPVNEATADGAADDAVPLDGALINGALLTEVGPGCTRPDHEHDREDITSATVHKGQQ